MKRDPHTIIKREAKRAGLTCTRKPVLVHAMVCVDRKSPTGVTAVVNNDGRVTFLPFGKRRDGRAWAIPRVNPNARRRRYGSMLGLANDTLAAFAETLIGLAQTGVPHDELVEVFYTLSPQDRWRLMHAVDDLGGNTRVRAAYEDAFELDRVRERRQLIYGAFAMLSGVVSAVHGYHRNKRRHGSEAVLPAVGWGILGIALPGVVPLVALAQGYGKPA